MNLNSNAVGLSARQKINSQFNNFFWVLLILLVILLASAVRVNGQLRDLKKAPPKTSNEPKIDIKINRHYDNKGNVIGYDSTYSSYYSSIRGDTIGMHNVMKNFNGNFNIHPWHLNRAFDNIFTNDSTTFPSFFGNDFFLNVDDHFQRRFSTSGQLRGLKKGLPKNSNDPKVDIKVNRHYDNEGNCIGYDSTYSSFHSGVQGDTLGMHNLMRNFDSHQGKERSPFFDKLFDTQIFNDSIIAPGLFHYDFPNHNFFLNQDEWNKFLDDMAHRIDSLKNGFFHEDHKRRYRL